MTRVLARCRTRSCPRQPSGVITKTSHRRPAERSPSECGPRPTRPCRPPVATSLARQGVPWHRRQSGVPGKEIVVGDFAGAHATQWRVVTYRKGSLVTLPPPPGSSLTRSLRWATDGSYSFQLGWSRSVSSKGAVYLKKKDAVRNQSGRGHLGKTTGLSLEVREMGQDLDQEGALQVRQGRLRGRRLAPTRTPRLAKVTVDMPTRHSLIRPEREDMRPRQSDQIAISGTRCLEGQGLIERCGGRMCVDQHCTDPNWLRRFPPSNRRRAERATRGQGNRHHRRCSDCIRRARHRGERIPSSRTPPNGSGDLLPANSSTKNWP